jgi:hypothetical protein
MDAGGIPMDSIEIWSRADMINTACWATGRRPASPGKRLPPWPVTALWSRSVPGFRGSVKKGDPQDDLLAAKGDLAGIVPPARVGLLHAVEAPANPDSEPLTQT